MAPASPKNLSATAAVLLILVILATSQPASVAEQTCRHLSGSYKGICAYSLSCYFVCTDESEENIDGSCDFLQCWCYTKCPSDEIVAAAAAASAPMIQP
ncbi:hypothetical protein PVAP13_3KG447900 [Panicum virgatum]|uniref:Knottins-like domain-containing protein n=1 Tax=Panicum virgatum TaxID=38727 RepID=A0A8T0V3E6_PANVG|nr:hypothetical protein PVAP13_3KG447900 [Panicum virgatum]